MMYAHEAPTNALSWHPIFDSIIEGDIEHCHTRFADRHRTPLDHGRRNPNPTIVVDPRFDGQHVDPNRTTIIPEIHISSPA